MELKDIEYEVVPTYPNRTPEYLTICPTGKVPALETNDGVLIETNVILEYLDEISANLPLIHGNSFEKARIRELIKILELYIELPSRRCHPEVFFGASVSESTKKEVKRALLNGMQSLSSVASFSPYLAGDKFSAADIFFLYSVDLATVVAKKLFDIDLLEHAPGAKELMKKLNSMPEVQKIAEDKKLAAPAFNAYVAKAYANK